jgi:putative membrane protein
MRILVWLARAFVFFTLFAFALNNQQTVTVHWFFGVDWSAPMVIVVLAAFALGSVIGALAMLPGWWRNRRDAGRKAERSPVAAAAGTATAPAPAAEHPPRDGL